MNVSPTSQRLIEEFDDAAQTWGWEKDQGSEQNAGIAERKHFFTLKALVKRVEYLEKALKRKNLALKILKESQR